MKLILLLLLFDLYFLIKYEKGREKYQILVLIFLILILYEISFIETFTKPIRIIFEVTGLLFLFFQFYDLKPNKKYQNVVILGCGLLDNHRLSNLMIQRCDVAIQHYHFHKMKIIVSGGQGKDESISEAMAMKNYLLSQDVLEEDIICENKSTSTKENLLYTSYLIGKKFTVVTSDFHRFRVYLLSFMHGLNISVITSKTIFYYRIIASIREYFAILSLFPFCIIISYFLLFFLL